MRISFWVAAHYRTICAASATGSPAVPPEQSQPCLARIVYFSATSDEEIAMKLVVIAAVAALAVTPALAAPGYPDSDTDSTTTVVVPPPANPNMDAQTATADAARQDYYQDKLDAAKAQAKVDSAAADRDAAQDRAAEDRAVARDAEDNR
jgi:hypothetical protein